MGVLDAFLSTKETGEVRVLDGTLVFLKEKGRKMKYKVLERVLNEIVNAPDYVKLGEVEANSEAEALKLAEITYPNSPSLKVEKAD